MMNENKVIVERRPILNETRTIAQIRITFPEGVDPPIGLNEFYATINEKIPVKNEIHNFIEKNPWNYVVEVRGTHLVYSWMDAFITAFKHSYPKYKIKVIGEWKTQE